MNAAALKEIDEAIEDQAREVERIRATVPELVIAEADLAALKRSRAILGGLPQIEAKPKATIPTRAPSSSRFKVVGPMPIADAIESVLKESGEMHADELLARLKDLGVVTTKASMVSTIIRYAKRNKRFKRTGRPNTFAVL